MRGHSSSARAYSSRERNGIQPLSTKGISPAPGRHARGVSPGRYRAEGFAAPLSVPAEALPSERTPQRRAGGGHCAQVSQESKKVCLERVRNG